MSNGTPNPGPDIRVDAASTRSGNKLATTVTVSGDTASLLQQAATGPKNVALQRSAALPTPDQPLWSAIPQSHRCDWLQPLFGVHQPTALRGHRRGSPSVRIGILFALTARGRSRVWQRPPLTTA